MYGLFQVNNYERRTQRQAGRRSASRHRNSEFKRVFSQNFVADHSPEPQNTFSIALRPLQTKRAASYEICRKEMRHFVIFVGCLLTLNIIAHYRLAKSWTARISQNLLETGTYEWSGNRRLEYLLLSCQ